MVDLDAFNLERIELTALLNWDGGRRDGRINGIYTVNAQAAGPRARKLVNMISDEIVTVRKHRHALTSPG